MKPKNDGILIRKLASKTYIHDCHEDLRKWLGLSIDDCRGVTDNWRRIPLISDVPHDVWQISTKSKIFYGKTLGEVSKLAGIKIN